MHIIVIFAAIFLVVWGISADSNDSSTPLKFRFSFLGPLDGWHCVLVDELTPPGWDDNYICTNKPLSLTYSRRSEECQRVDNIKCVNLVVPSDPNWFNNRLCVPQESHVQLVWSYCGPISNMECVKFDEPWSSSLPYFDNSYLCWKEY
jgi:hypothetical protein